MAVGKYKLQVSSFRFDWTRSDSSSVLLLSPSLALAEGLEIVLVSFAAAVVKLATGAGRGVEVEP